jgi:hypothetical protein
VSTCDSVLKLQQSTQDRAYLENSYCYRKTQKDMKAIQVVLIRIRGEQHSSNPMSSKEAKREEMKDETHDVEDMEQDELVEKDSEDEGS